jgi:hypothetical protein
MPPDTRDQSGSFSIKAPMMFTLLGERKLNQAGEIRRLSCEGQKAL